MLMSFATASSLEYTSNSGAGFKGPSAGLVASVSWGIKYFCGKFFCGPSGHHSTGVTASLAKLPLWSQAGGRRCMASPQAHLEASGLVKASSDLKSFNRNLSWWSQMTQEQWMQGGPPWLSTSVCALRYQSGASAEATPSGHPTRDACGFALPWGTCDPHTTINSAAKRCRLCSPAEAVRREKTWNTGTHMKRIISKASTSAQRPHTLSQGFCRTHCEVQEECFHMMLNVLPCLGRETCFVLPFLVCE